ncbi:hypothetical protein EVAR_32244_1 [Eumeta japonica]|uniref:Uncharacterized protein n=1 Tax=Eumeta variegata TaxID=151549 RepID=A0A4C1WXU0_EUMVA|nr:hypothetical protein EVAR_32244_1 [Eumeta japonica]
MPSKENQTDSFDLVAFLRSKRTCELSERKWPSSPTDTLILKGVTSALPASWVGMGHLMGESSRTLHKVTNLNDDAPTHAHAVCPSQCKRSPVNEHKP